MLEDSAGNVWIGTNGGGLALFRNNRITAVTSNVIPSAISAVLQDNAGNLWLSSEQGLDRLTDAHHSTQALQVTRHCRRPRLFRHLGHRPPLCCATHGWPPLFRCTQGRPHRRSHTSPLRSAALPIVIEQITADDRDISQEQLASLPPGIAHLAINFAAIHLAAPQRVQYRYMLKGFDPHLDRSWHAAHRLLHQPSTNSHGGFIAGVVLITTGYAANGKYSHFFETLVPIAMETITLAPGKYVLGWEHGEEASTSTSTTPSPKLRAALLKPKSSPAIHASNPSTSGRCKPSPSSRSAASASPTPSAS